MAEEKSLEQVAEEKRNENNKVDGYENKNPYSKAVMKELLTGEKSKGVAATDFTIDLVPTILLAAASKFAKHSDAYKGAKLREHADNADYHAVGPHRLGYVEGTVSRPVGVMGHIIYKQYGKPAKEEAEKQVNKVLRKLARKYKVSADKADDWVQSISSGVYDDVPEGFIKDLLKERKNVEKYFEKVNQPANEVLSANVKMKEGTRPGKPKVESKGTDEIITSLPSTLSTVAGINTANDVANSLFKAKDDHEERFKRLKANNGGLHPTSPFLTITNILDGFTDGTWRYNRKEAISVLNEIYDYVKEHGNEEQLKKVIEVYANTDFSKKSEAVNALKELTRLTQ